MVDTMTFLRAAPETPDKFPKTTVFKKHGLWTVHLKLKEFGARENPVNSLGRQKPSRDLPLMIVKQKKNPYSEMKLAPQIAISSVATGIMELSG